VHRRERPKRDRRSVALADERGVALTEFALVTPILVLVIAGMLGFGLIFFYWLDANRLASETARWAVVDSNPFGKPLQQHILDEVPNGMKDGLSVCIDFPANPSDPTPTQLDVGDAVRVRVQKTVSLIPLLGIGDVNVRASSTMRIERFANGVAPPVNYRPGPPSGTPPGDDVGTGCT